MNLMCRHVNVIKTTRVSIASLSVKNNLRLNPISVTPDDGTRPRTSSIHTLFDNDVHTEAENVHRSHEPGFPLV